MSKQIAAELVLPEARITGETLRDNVLPAVPKEQYAFFRGQIARSLAIQMNNEVAAEPNSIVL